MGYSSKNPAVSTQIITDQVAAAVSAAPTGKHRIINRNGALYMVDSSGVETPVGSGTGSGEKNYVENPSAAAAITGWANVGDLDVARTTTAGDLPREYTTGTGIKITADSNTQSTADYVYYDFTLDDVDLNKKLKISWSQKTTGTYNAGDLAVVITTQADRTTAVATPITTAIPAADGVFTTSFDSGSTATLSLVIRATTDMTTDGGIVISDVVVGPGIQPQGAVVGPPVTWTPSVAGVTGGSATITGSYVRVGNRMRGYIRSVWGTIFTGGTNPRFSLPSGLTIDTSASGLASAVSTYTVVGSAALIDTGTVTYPGVAFYYDTSTLQIQAVDDDQGTGGSFARYASVSTTGPHTWANNDVIEVTFEVPIAEWAGSGTLNVAQNDVEYAHNSSSWDSTDSSSFAYGPAGAAITGTLGADRVKRVRFQTPIQAGDRLELEFSDDQVVWMPVGSDVGILIEPYQRQNSVFYGAGLYRVASSVTDVDVNFAQYRYASGATFGAAGAAWATGYFWRVRKSSSGQAVGFGEVRQSSSGLVKSAGQLLGTNTNDSAATGYVGETLSQSRLRSAATSATTGTPLNVTATALTLTAGHWRISGAVAFVPAATTTVTYIAAAISTTSATFPATDTYAVPNSSGEVRLQWMSASYTPNATVTMPLPSYTVKLAASTTFYLVAETAFAVSTMTVCGSIYAERVR